MDSYKTAIKRHERNMAIFKKIGSLPSKFVIILLVVALNAGLLNVPQTRAFYNDIESTNGNNWTAGALDFTLIPEDFDSHVAALNFEPRAALGKTIGMNLETESNPMIYQASTTAISGDGAFCDAINLNASLDNQNQFDGRLTDFVSVATTTVSTWQYDFSLPTDSHFYNSVCSFSFEYRGRQTAPHHEYSDSGFYDIEKATSTISSWGFRINKVYYDVDTAKRGADPANEWVEIYNQTDQALDVRDWEICDKDECDLIASTSPILIPAKGFAVITASSTTWNYWALAENVVPILLSDKQIGNGLANGGDRLILKRPDGVIIDQMNWRADTGVWNPGAVNVGDGRSLGRKPNGYDTDQASDFISLAMPLVNLINPDQSGTATWYWTYNYNLSWLATNQNGPDSDLLIDLSYIKDSDNTSTITAADEEISIAKGLPNSGSHNWTVPTGFIGYIWIKIVAFGPENPMLNSQMTSGKIYDPYPLELVLTDPAAVLEGLLDMIDSATTTPDKTEPAETQTEKIEIFIDSTSSSTLLLSEITPVVSAPMATSTQEQKQEAATSTDASLEENEVFATTTEAVKVEPVVLSEPEPALKEEEIKEATEAEQPPAVEPEKADVLASFEPKTEPVISTE